MENRYQAETRDFTKEEKKKRKKKVFANKQRETKKYISTFHLTDVQALLRKQGFSTYREGKH